MSPLLRRSFDSAKCKTVLQLTVQKLKILRNKHTLVVKSLRADVARLLEKGQDSSAKTQVDNVFREEKIVALYNILEQFCQLVINGLEIIKSQRECPSDLKEAVASLIYAASRCEEIEELKKVSSYLTNKYGTEFTLAAKELRSDCGVNTQVIQNLSSLPLSSDARMKLLKDVAVENRIKWDYDTTIADMSKQPTDSHDGPIHPTSETQTFNMSSAERQRPASMTMHVNEVNGWASEGLKTSFNSRIMSPKTALDSSLHNMHQPAKINTSLETKEVCSSSRAKIIPTSILDPYALAKLQGRMDYKLVSEDKGREYIIEEHLNSTSSFKVTQSNRQSRSPGSSKMLNIKQMSTAGRQDMEMQLLELEAAAKIALESASDAAEAARAAVAMVRKESLGSIKTCRLENTQKPDSELSPEAALDEARFDAIKDDSRFSPSAADNLVVLNDYASEDTQQMSGSQQRPLQAHDSAKLDTIISGCGESRSTEVPKSSSIGSFYSTYEREKDVDWKISHRQKQERLFIEERIQQDKTVKNISAEPQFDDCSSEEALEEERPFYASKNASSKHQHESIFGVVEVQSGKDVQKECSVPQFDDDSIEEANEDETPFYLKGRAAMVGMAKVRSSKLMATSSTDDTIEESSNANLEDTKKVVNLNAEYQEEASDSSTNTGEQAFIEEHLKHSLEFTGSARPSSKSLKNYYTSPIDALSGISGSESSYLDSRYDNLPSPLKSVRSFSPTGGLPDFEDENPLSHVRRNLKWCSTISKNAEFTSESSIESYKPSNLEDSSLQLPNSYFGVNRATKQDSEISPQSIEASQTKYKGMSRRSVRSSRPREIQNNPSSTA